MHRRTSFTSGVIISTLIIVVLSATIAIPSSSFQKTKAVAVDNVGGKITGPRTQAISNSDSSNQIASTNQNGIRAPIASSGNNVYIAWWSNKTGNDEVMFKASTDAGKTFGDKMNLSNSSKSESQDVQIAAAGNIVYVTWWERNQTSNEPVLRVSNDNGKTFGEKIILSAK